MNGGNAKERYMVVLTDSTTLPQKRLLAQRACGILNTIKCYKEMVALGFLAARGTPSMVFGVGSCVLVRLIPVWFVRFGSDPLGLRRLGFFMKAVKRSEKPKRGTIRKEPRTVPHVAGQTNKNN